MQPTVGAECDRHGVLGLIQVGEEQVAELIEGQLERLLDHPLLEVMAVKTRVENPLGLEWSKNHITRISDEVGFVDTVVGNINWIIHQLLERNDTAYPVLVTLFRKGNGTMIVSLRSRNGEALKIAEKLQGGGHANACGASLPKSVRTVQDAVGYLRNVLNLTPSQPSALNSLEAIFSAIEAKQG